MSRLIIILTIIIVLEIILVGLLPYSITRGRLSVPFPHLRAEYSCTVSVPGYASIPSRLVLTTGSVVNSSYIEVTETVLTAAGTVSTSLTFYVNLFNRSVLIVKELLPELPPHGEYYDLWIGEEHAPGEVLRILNQTVTLSGSGLRFYGWTFFNTVMASDLDFNASMEVALQGQTVMADYRGRISIVYDLETGLMLEDRQAWTVSYVLSGFPQTLSYTVAFTYAGSNVVFGYSTYALTIGIYSALVLIVLVAMYAIIRVVQKRRAQRRELERQAKEAEGAQPPMPPPEEGPPPPPPPPSTP
jgi:hypothetical protein